jgi:hypothetical protein
MGPIRWLVQMELQPSQAFGRRTLKDSWGPGSLPGAHDGRSAWPVAAEAVLLPAAIEWITSEIAQRFE